VGTNPKNDDFESARRLAALVSKEYARDLFRLLVMYKDISASEAAARIGLHVKTAQDFLEGLEEAGVVSKREAEEKKRPYFRYSLERTTIHIALDLDALFETAPHAVDLKRRVRERRDSGALFKEGRGEIISAVHVYEGQGRSRKERRLGLTERQGRFLFHLPFPTEPFQPIEDIGRRAGIGEDDWPEILDLLDSLIESEVIEVETA
jgi:predicted transcriptional regulator